MKAPRARQAPSPIPKGRVLVKKILSALVLAALVAFAPSAQAQLAFDFKLAYALPMGDVALDFPFSDAVSGALPIGLDARYKFTPNLSAGVYFQYAPMFVKNCGQGFSCSATDVRLGIEAVYAFMPDAGFNPWVGVGTGWEWTTLKASGGGEADRSFTYDGWEYFNIQVGGDFALSKMFAVGPYVGFSGGTYTTLSGSSGSTSNSVSIPSADRAFHSWFQFGVKGTLNL
jgi:outer membrane protein W